MSSPEIKQLTQLRVIGHSRQMSQMNDSTRELWTNFMTELMKNPELKQRSLVNMRMYDKEMALKDFQADTIFTKCASYLAEAKDQPIHGMSEFIIPSGKYAVFKYKGLPADADRFFHKIFTELLPAANLKVANDSRPHFDIMDKNYHQSNPESEESIYIPVK